MNNYLKLIEIIRLMASSHTEQLSCFSQKVCRPDELLFTFEECFVFINDLLEFGDINERIFKLITDIDACFNDFEASDWTEDAVCSSSKWNTIRKIANEILTELHVPLLSPNLFWIKDIG